MRVFPLKTTWQYLLAGLMICFYYPLLTHLDRGQIDLITLLFITLSLVFMIKRTKRNGVLSGILLAAATLLKLNCIYIIPFILIRKRWDVLRGYISGGILIIVASVVVTGWDYLYDYTINQFPRIAGIAEADYSLGRSEKQKIREMLQSIPDGYSIKDGRSYKLEIISFSTDATLVEPLSKYLEKNNVFVSRSLISLLLFCVTFSLIWMWQTHYFFTPASIQDEFLFWQIPLAVILLTSPLTWTMNTVWLLPFAVILVSHFSIVQEKAQRLFTLPLLVGFLLVGIEDTQLHYFALPSNYWGYKYMAGEVIIILGILSYLTVAGLKAKTRSMNWRIT